MKLLADESIDRQIVEAFREKRFIVDYVAEMDPGISDDMVLKIANQEEVILSTADKDFGELMFRLHHISSGIVLVRLAGLSPNKKSEIVVSFIMKHLAELKGSFSVITSLGIRIRHQKQKNENHNL